jgi:hypothetical protein
MNRISIRTRAQPYMPSKDPTVLHRLTGFPHTVDRASVNVHKSLRQQPTLAL